MSKLIQFAFKTGLIRLGRPLWSKSLTVLNYHRIDDLQRPDFDSFKPNISATPEDFDRQMEYISRWFHVVSVKDIVQWLEGRYALPRHAALITFDDGYLDNYTNAFPILRKYSFPAVVFLTTGHIETNNPFFWDLVAYCFSQTVCKTVSFPDGKSASWKDLQERDLVAQAWVESMKSLPETEKQSWVTRLPEELRVSIPHNYFRNLMMNWDQIREMHRSGIEFGGHTINHPILTRIPLEQAAEEIKGSKEKIEKELGQPVLSFAYPNGMENDLNAEIEKIVSDAGYKVAFTLISGPTSMREVKQDPYAIRRIFISHRDTLPHFATFVSQVNRFRNR